MASTFTKLLFSICVNNNNTITCDSNKINKLKKLDINPIKIINKLAYTNKIKKNHSQVELTTLIFKLKYIMKNQQQILKTNVLFKLNINKMKITITICKKKSKRK